MSATADLATAPKEPEARRHQEILEAAPQPAATGPDAGLFSRIFSGAPGEPPAGGANRLLRHPALSHPVNQAVRAGTLQRAQRDYGNQVAQRLLPGPSSSPDAPQPVIQARAAAPAAGGGNGKPQVMPSGGPGEPLPRGTRELMESRFGDDFSGVRVHSGPQAAASAQGLKADAYTSGRDIYFAPGKYAPDQAAGQRLLAHELTHVVQQRQGSSEAPGAAHEVEADRAALAVQGGAPATVRQRSAAGVPQFGPNEDLDKLLQQGPTVEPPTAAEVEGAMTRLSSGTATAADQQILLRQTIADTRAYMQAESGEGLSWSVCKGRCGPGRDVSAASFGSMAGESAQPISIARFQAKEVFGYGKHGFSVVTFSDGGQYIVDPTFGQFLRPGTAVDAAGQATAQFLRGDPAGAKLAAELVQNGFVRLTPENAKLFARSMGVPEVEAGKLASRLFKGEYSEITELVGAGRKTVYEVGKGGPDILDRSELVRFLKEEHIPSLKRTGDPHNLLPRLRKLVERLEEGPGLAPKGLPGEGGKGWSGEGEGGGVRGGGGGLGGLFKKGLLAYGIYSTGKRLKQTWGTEEFGITVAEEGMIWGSAFTPLGPAGPLLMSLAFWFGEAWGQALATLLDKLPGAVEALSKFAEHSSAIVGDIFLGHLLVLHESLDPDNWDLALMPNELIGPTDQLGTAIWAKMGNLDLDGFSARMVQPLSALGLPRDAVANFAAQWSLLQTKETGAPTTLEPEQILAMTPPALIEFLKADKLRFLQDPELLSRQAFYGETTVLEKGEESRLRDLVEQRAMINPYNWKLDDLPNLDTRDQDKAALKTMGEALWAQLARLEKDNFHKMSAMPMSTFTFKAEQLDNTAAALARLSFPFLEMSPEMIAMYKEMFLRMTPQDLIRFMRAYLKLHFLNDPAMIASDAIAAVKQGYRPWTPTAQ